VQREDVILALARLPEITDEPIAFPAIVPTYLIFRKIREVGIKVVLVGDGGDELFWGYEPGTYAHFLTTLRLRPLWPLLAGPPGRLGKRLAEVDAIARLLPLGWLNVLRRAQFVFDAHTVAQQYFSMIRFTSQADLERMLGGVSLPNPAELLQISRFEETFVRHPLESVTLFDIFFNLADFNLDRVDRTSMANSVEARAPLLDYRLVELALSIPVSRKRMGGRPKALLKQVLSRYLPRHLWDRRKQGFDAPASAWLREHLREQAYDLLRSADGMFDREFLQRRFRRHLDAGIDELNVTWPVFVLLQWWNHWVKTSGVVSVHR
jgi:asparagine synthase (glutamine-hydrolysing)